LGVGFGVGLGVGFGVGLGVGDGVGLGLLREKCYDGFNTIEKKIRWHRAQ